MTTPGTNVKSFKLLTETMKKMTYPLMLYDKVYAPDTTPNQR